MRRLLGALGLCLWASLSLAGCVRLVWDKRGATDAMFKTDTYECERDMRQVNYRGSNDRPGAFFNRCMEARGWSLVRDEEGDPNRERFGPSRRPPPTPEEQASINAQIKRIEEEREVAAHKDGG